MADIIDLESVKIAKVDEALDTARGRYRSLMVIGWDVEDDLLVVYGGDIGDADIVFLLELVKLNILTGEL